MMVTSTVAIDRTGGPAASAAHPVRRSAGVVISRSCLLLPLFAVFVIASAVAGPATVLLDFEGVGDNNLVGNFYGGGAGGPNKDYGVVFGGGGFVDGAVDTDAGGSFAIAKEPSPSTVAYVNAESGNVFVTVSGGFTAMSFQCTTGFLSATVTIYDGPDATGNILGTATFPPTFICGVQGIPACGDPNGVFGVWTNVTVPFSGVAKSASFASVLYLDDVVMTLVSPPTDPPTKAPSNPPTKAPSKTPTNAPTNPPTKVPTNRPTRFPTKRPTRLPTRTPTSACLGLKGMKGNMKRCMKKKMMMLP